MRKLLTRKNIIWGLVAFLLGAAIPPNITSSKTDSLRYHKFIMNHFLIPGNICRGAYVVFPLRENEYFKVTSDKPMYAIKRVACAAGSELLSVFEHFYCDGEYIGVAKEFSSTGKRVTHFSYQGLVPTGSLFVMGDHPDSYDSRYFGFVRKDEVYAVAYPIY